MPTVNEVLPDLGQFTGAETWYQHPLMRRVTYTEGVKYVADTTGAHWLIDKIAANQLDPEISVELFQVWKLTVDGTRGEVTCEDGNGKVIHREVIDYTDFPEPGITLWYTDHVILLPSEY